MQVLEGAVPMNSACDRLGEVPYIGVSDMISIVQSLTVRRFLRELSEYIEQDFKRWESFDKSPRHACHSAEGVIELMPVSDQERYSFKFVNGHPRNAEMGRQTVAAFGALASVETGYPVLLSEMTLLTALRTAATSALAAKHLARPDAKVMTLIGNGAQSEFQALAFQELLGIEEVRLFDTDRHATEKCAGNLADTDLRVVKCGSVEEAVERAEIITTATADKKKATILTDNLIGAGAHLNAIGGDCPGKTELHKDILLRSEIFVEYAPQTRVEGELQQLPSDYPATELWQVISNRAPGRRTPEQVTLFDGVGFALEDYSALRYVQDASQALQRRSYLDLVAAPEDTRDLYRMLSAN